MRRAADQHFNANTSNLKRCTLYKPFEVRSFLAQRRKPSMKLQVGEKAPEFELRSDTMERVELSALRGSKLLLLFVPLAFTST